MVMHLSKQTQQSTTKPTETPPQRTRWTTLRTPVSFVVFLAIASLIEYGVVLYVLSLGLQDTSVLQWTFQFPGTSSPVTLSISPLLHLAPICIVITLGFCWTYLAKKTGIRRQEIRKGRVELPQKQRTEKRGLAWKIRHAGRSYSRRTSLWLSKSKVVIYLSRASIKSAAIVLVVFVAFILMFMTLVYPQLIYGAVTNAYRTDPGLASFVTGFNKWAQGAAQTLAPIGWIATALNNALLSAAPSVGYIGSALGALIAPLATLDNMGKFLVLQNAAAGISVLIVLVHGERAGRGYRYKK
jgi:hypothetical protein